MAAWATALEASSSPIHRELISSGAEIAPFVKDIEASCKTGDPAAMKRISEHISSQSPMEDAESEVSLGETSIASAVRLFRGFIGGSYKRADGSLATLFSRLRFTNGARIVDINKQALSPTAPEGKKFASVFDALACKISAVLRSRADGDSSLTGTFRLSSIGGPYCLSFRDAAKGLVVPLSLSLFDIRATFQPWGFSAPVVNTGTELFAAYFVIGCDESLSPESLFCIARSPDYEGRGPTYVHHAAKGGPPAYLNADEASTLIREHVLISVSYAPLGSKTL